MRCLYYLLIVLYLFIVLSICIIIYALFVLWVSIVVGVEGRAEREREKCLRICFFSVYLCIV